MGFFVVSAAIKIVVGMCYLGVSTALETESLRNLVNEEIIVIQANSGE